MDVFALLFVVSFLALIFTLVVMHIRKHTKTKDNVAKGEVIIMDDTPLTIYDRF